MSNLATTVHAETRIRQRGIPPWVLEVLLEHGKARHDGHGAELISFPKRNRKHLQRILSRSRYAEIERHLNVYAVMGPDGAVLTAGHRTRRMRLN